MISFSSVEKVAGQDMKFASLLIAIGLAVSIGVKATVDPQYVSLFCFKIAAASPLLAHPAPSSNAPPTSSTSVGDLIRNIQKGMTELTENLNKITNSVAKLSVNN
jgi:hypothetical protein